MESSLKKKLIISYLMFLIIILIVANISLSNEGIYEVYVNGSSIGCYSEVDDIRNKYNNIKEQIDDIVCDNNGKGEFTYRKVKAKNINESNDNIRDLTISSINTEAILTKIVINDKCYGSVLNEKEGKDVLKRLGELYIEKNNINKDNILSVDVKANIKYEKIKDRVCNIPTIDEIANNIIRDSNFNDIVTVEVLSKEVREDKIYPITKIIRRDDMYIGESLTNEGEEGRKEIVASVLYNNGIKKNEEIIKEDVISESVDTIIYRGTKNPINDGIAFLSNPTRGGYVTSNFGPRWGSTHSGMDIAGEFGDPVYAALDGVVVECKYDGNYGNKILLRHEDNISTIYGHLSKFEVNVGDEIKKGDTIGRIGSTGRSTGPHLHFEVRANGNPVNPKKYILN